MDNLTHSLVGAVIGQTGLKRKTGLGMAALIIGANLPDVDAACFFWLDGTQHLAFRRGITHGPPAWVLLPLVLAGILWAFDRWQASRGKRPEGRLPVHFGWLYALSFIGCLSHPALDWLNTYGIRLLEPFSSRWFYGDILFIIDPWLWALLIGGLWWSRKREKKGGEWRPIARNALAIMGIYLVANFAISERERRANTAFAETIASPVPLAFWHRDVVGIGGGGSFFQGSEKLGNLPLTACDLAAARASSKDIDAFLFWSRAPLLDRTDEGVFLGDARYYGSAAASGFQVQVPDRFCTEP